VRLVLATHDFASLGGSETYLLTAAQQLQRLGHEVTIHTVNAGEMTDLARASGVLVAVGESQLPAAWDAALVQDAGMALALRALRPEAPVALRASSEVSDFQLPPALAGVVAAVIALSERVADRIRAMDDPPPVIRLRQAIDVDRFAPRVAPRPRPEVAVVLGNHLRGQRLEALRSAWEPEGIDIRVVGRHGTASAAPETALAEADIAVAKGRALLEGMACGRPAYVYDFAGTDGWVTPERYPAMEAEGFGGRATDRTTDPALMRADLADYDPAMGLANRDLVIAHHSARRHAEELAGVLGGLTSACDGQADRAPLREMARLVRLQQATEARAAAAALAAQIAAEDARRLATELDAAMTELVQLRTQREAVETNTRQAAELWSQIDALRATRRYRLAGAIGGFVDALGMRRDPA
jgi:hypothetical protein